MKITKSQLKRIIKEELEGMLSERIDVEGENMIKEAWRAKVIAINDELNSKWDPIRDSAAAGKNLHKAPDLLFNLWMVYLHGTWHATAKELYDSKKVIYDNRHSRFLDKATKMLKNGLNEAVMQAAQQKSGDPIDDLLGRSAQAAGL